jgi:hypothetical protein
MPEGEEVEEDKEGEEEKPEEQREEIKIKDFSEYKKCSVCGELKVPYIEVESSGGAEFTCADCYESIYSQGAKLKCPSCESECPEEDNFCWKCGYRLRLICATCGFKSDTDDKFCRRCGEKL